ncbi:MAG: hypothetical protein NXH95_10145 [Pseudomonadaceae bacterium]|nr:hypothetical protein [Pseudomonadaceae bacterium]
MVDVKFDAADNMVYLRCEGELSLEDIVQGIRQWMQHEHYAADTNLLCDVARAQWQHAVSDFLQVSEAVVERINQNWQGRKIAIVTNSYTEIALIESHLGAMGWEAQWRGFLNTDAARHWLHKSNPQTTASAS